MMPLRNIHPHLIAIHLRLIRHPRAECSLIPERVQYFPFRNQMWTQRAPRGHARFELAKLWKLWQLEHRRWLFDPGALRGYSPPLERRR